LPCKTLTLALLAALALSTLAALLAALPGLLLLLTRLLLAAALLAALATLTAALVLLAALLARLLFVGVHICSFNFLPAVTTRLPNLSSSSSGWHAIPRRRALRPRGGNLISRRATFVFRGVSEVGKRLRYLESRPAMRST
jgi:hypothetical protein